MRKRRVGGDGCGLGCSMSQEGGRTAGKMRGHGGRLEGQAYQRVFEDRAERAGCMNHNRMEK